MQQSVVRKPAMSFIIRVWEDGANVDMRGELEHVGTGERRLFADAASLLHLIEAWRREK